jgi:hypothetical protein
MREQQLIYTVLSLVIDLDDLTYTEFLSFGWLEQCSKNSPGVRFNSHFSQTWPFLETE